MTLQTALRRAGAFTFVELTIVAAIIAFLTTIAMPNFLEAKTRAKAAAAKADLTVLSGALETYRVEQWQYPLNAASGRPGDWDLIALTTPVPYLSELKPDVFMNGLGVVGLKEQGFDKPPPCRFFNALQIDPDKGLRPANGMTSGFFSGYTAAVAWSTGPVVDRDAFTVIDDKGRFSAVVYDPTNGAISNGDIYARSPGN